MCLQFDLVIPCGKIASGLDYREPCSISDMYLLTRTSFLVRRSLLPSV